ncbi:DMT family transporter [Flavicella sediminum]|uniref:DMT family transporter n=1 Tax=Flavicella sediminum TaxID=2585141 RepID=UPI001AA04A11|nr:DMT family transporter [Flavicella sediminum]
MKENKWLYLIVLSLMWGSSFILMKKALLGLSPIQIGALRILVAGFVLLAFSYKKVLKIKKKHWMPIAQVGFIASFFPAFFFAFAIHEIDSSVSAILNSLTPLITMLLGALFFNFVFQKKQIVGVFVGLLGTLMLIAYGMQVNPEQNYAYALLIFIASIGYALGMNIVKSKLLDIDALSITAGSFTLLIPPAFVILCFSGFFEVDFSNELVQESFGYIVLLALLGTTIAKVLFNKLVQISSPIFSSSITYLITVVAVAWGVLDGERLSLYQFFSIGVIFLGVFLVNKKAT